MTANGMAELQDVFTDAQAYGARLAQLLSASMLPPDVQDAWAALVPAMIIAQLQQFELLLRAHMDGEVHNALEDTFLEIRAEITKHSLAVAGATHKANVALDALEQKIDALERAGGKRSE